MISFIGLRPVEPVDWPLRAMEATRVADERLAMRLKTRQTATPQRRTIPRKDDDFPTVWREEKKAFVLAQHDKCAYCETVVSAGHPGNVEHYRPKAKVEIMTRGDRDDTKGPPRRSVTHRFRGYAWLAYDWINYLFSCTRCNSIWKLNQFPIGGLRAKTPGRLAKELPLLLNPFDTNPAPHFAYDYITGMIVAQTKQGQTTIDICGLDRTTLETQRRIKADKMQSRFVDYEFALARGSDEFQRRSLRSIFDECRDFEPYAGMARHLAEERIGLTYAEMFTLYQRGDL